MTDAATIAAGNRHATEANWTGPTEALVKGIIAALEAELPRELIVGEMPDKPSKFDLGDQPGAALVHYQGSKYARASTAGLAAQDRTPTLDIHLIVRGLTGRLGAYALTDLCFLYLQGRNIAGLTLHIASDGLVRETDGIWDYAVQVTGTMPSVGRRHLTPQRSAL